MEMDATDFFVEYYEVHPQFKTMALILGIRLSSLLYYSSTLHRLLSPTLASHPRLSLNPTSKHLKQYIDTRPASKTNLT